MLDLMNKLWESW